MADEDPVAHRVPALGTHPFVIESDGGQPEFDSPVGSQFITGDP
jgi:hypothetical protein